MATKNEELIKGALVSGVINAMINGTINWFQVRGKTELYLTVDNISTDVHTVFGGAVILATMLAVIITGVGYFSLKSVGKPAYFPKVFLMSLKNGFFAFGLIITVAILLQRFVGSVVVSPLVSALLVALVAGLTAGLVEYVTKLELLKSKN